MKSRIARTSRECSISRYACTNIVNSQSANDFTLFQIPEPWAGRISITPILFLSSNPAFNPKETWFPTMNAESSDIKQFCNDRFHDLSSQPRSVNGTHVIIGGTKRRIPFWIFVRNRACELLERSPFPGDDYALTEVVHCKSAKQFGVGDAQRERVNRYLSRTLRVAAARVIVVLGQIAERSVKRIYGTK